MSLLSPLQSEVISLTLSWHNGLCGAQCASSLENRFKSVRGVAQVQTDFDAGRTLLMWKPRVSLDYNQVLLAAQRVGVSMDEARLKMRGTVSHAGQRFFIQSLGDGTRAEIFNLPAPSSTRHVDLSNIRSYMVNPDFQAKLIEAEKGHLLVTVEGALFEPEHPPFKLIVENYRIEYPENQNTDQMQQSNSIQNSSQGVNQRPRK